VWPLLILAAITTASPQGVSATRLDGTTVVGQIDAWNGERLTLATSDGVERIPTDELLALRISLQERRAQQLTPVLVTIGGSVIPTEGFAVQDGVARTNLIHTLPEGAAELQVPLPKVREIQLKLLDATLDEQWRDIRELSIPHDLLVIFKRGGKSLDYLEGTIGTITDEAIEFTTDGDRVEVPRSKVAGLVFYRRESPSSEPPCVLSGKNRLRLAAASVRLDQERLLVATTDGIKLTWPLNEISTADFSAGKLVFLSDMEPASQSWQPLVGLSAATTAMSEFGDPRFDRSASGGPLSIWHPDMEFSEGSGSIESFDKGIAVRSRSHLVFRLPKGFSRFVTLAGIEPETRASGNILLIVLGDDRPLLEAEISGQDAPRAIELDVAGVRRLTIVVDYGDNLDTGDWLNLCNARLVK
jgi:hypothetical protein